MNPKRPKSRFLLVSACKTFISFDEKKHCLVKLFMIV